MNSKAVLIYIITSSFFLVAARIPHVSAEPDVLQVPIDFPTIQAALNNANTGDTIFIHDGVYVENVVVNRTVSILGESSIATIIDGNNTGTTLTVVADNVSVQNVTIRGGGPNAYESGVHVTGSSCNLTDDIVMDNGLYGIYLDYSSNVLVSENLVTQNTADGIVLFGSVDNTVSASTFINNTFGIHLYTSNQNKIVNNTSANNTYGGISMFYSSDNLIADNSLTGNIGLGLILDYSSNNNTLIGNVVKATEGYGIILDGSLNNILRNNQMSGNTYNLYCPATRPVLTDFLNDIDKSNTVDEKPVYYLMNESGVLLDQSTAGDAGYVGLVNCTWMIVRNLDLSRNGQGLLLAYTDHSVVTRLNVSDNANGVQLLAADDNVITNNTIVRNLDYGVSLDYSSSENFIAYNTIANSRNAIKIEHEYTDANQILDNVIVNNQKGFWINSLVQKNIISENSLVNNSLAIDMRRESNNNKITKNMIVNNTQGIFMDWCYNNAIFSNNFVSNTVQLVTNNSKNYWDNGYPDGGNFWSNYNGTDSNRDGIGDAPYTIEGDNPDRYPLMGTLYDFEVFTENGETGHVQVISNSTISNFAVLQWLSSPNQHLQPGQEYILYTVAGESGTDGFCRTMIPRSVLNGTYTVLVDWQETPATELATSNATHAYLYFTYEHSTHEVIIVPEFPSIVVIPILIMTATLVIITGPKKKKLSRSAVIASEISLAGQVCPSLARSHKIPSSQGDVNYVDDAIRVQVEK